MESDFKRKAFELLGDTIRKKRIEQSLTQEELGLKVGYGELTRRQAISQIERGSVAIPNKKLTLFINLLKLDNTFISEINFLISKGRYEEAAFLLEEREAEERKIAASLSVHTPMTNEDTKTLFMVMGKNDPEQIEEPNAEEAGENDLPSVKDTISMSFDSAEQKLTRLKALFEKALINEEEYSYKKKEILDKYF